MKLSGINSGLTSPLANVLNRKRSFIFQRYDDLDANNFLTILKGDYIYLNKPISEDVNMNNRKLIN